MKTEFSIHPIDALPPCTGQLNSPTLPSLSPSPFAPCLHASTTAREEMQPWQSPEATSEGLLGLRPLSAIPIGFSDCTHHPLSVVFSGCFLRPALTSQLQQTPSPASSLPKTSGSDLWLVFSSPSKPLGASNSSPIASFGLRVSVAAAALS